MPLPDHLTRCYATDHCISCCLITSESGPGAGRRPVLSHASLPECGYKPSLQAENQWEQQHNKAPNSSFLWFTACSVSKAQTAG
ncbi:hypothetical protein AAFF_G00381080 [Aldrovandia affinis]|uniref:Uncharacterized protein n=1 Tax=Aldrovandia affinis TaxID=143900 RepID=A0AAD7T7W9_9TELE|nr:hypothetical protein AAFF_G00381080 [Aldrovandia affinis]